MRVVLQFAGEMGERMKRAYGEFCSRHNESVQLYKDILKTDRKFQVFIKVSGRRGGEGRGGEGRGGEGRGGEESGGDGR